MIISNIERNAQTVDKWYNNKLLRGSGHRNNPFLSVFFPFNSSQETIEEVTGVKKNELLDLVAKDYGQNAVSLVTQKALTDYLRWFWLLKQGEEKFTKTISDRKKWADPNVMEVTLVMSNRYVNMSVLIFVGEKAFVNSIVVNPYVKGKGLGSIAYRRMENFVTDYWKVQRLYLIPLQPKTDGGDVDMVPYWEKMGFSWPEDTYITTLDPKPSLQGNDEPERRRTTLTQGPRGQPVTTLSDGDWYPMHMWKDAEIYAQDKVSSTDESFNKEVDFINDMQIIVNSAEAINNTFMGYDPNHETKLNTETEIHTVETELKRSIRLLLPPGTRSLAEQAASNKRKREPPPPLKVPTITRADSNDSIEILTDDSPGVVNEQSLPIRKDMSKKLTTLQQQVNKPRKPIFATNEDDTPPAGVLVNETTAKQRPVTNAPVPFSTKKGVQYIGTYPPKIIDTPDAF